MPMTTDKTKTFHFRDFSGGINRTDARPSIKDTELYWALNAQPIGKGQLQIIPPQDTPITTISVGVAKMFGVLIKISGVETTRIITINNDGSMTSVDPVSGTQTVIGPPGTVTTSARVTMWQDNPLLIGDKTKGYMSWDGTNLVKYPLSLTGNTTNASPIITNIVPNTTGLVSGMSVVGSGIPNGTTIVSVNSSTQITVSNNATSTATADLLTVGSGAPTSVIDLSTFSGRAVLVSASRSRTYSAPGSYTDFTTVDGAITLNLTDSVFPGSIVRILSALEVLWIIGPGAVNADSNVQLGSGNITTVSDTNIVSNVGTLWPSSVSSFFRTFLFLTPYGVYAIVGATPQKLSEQLDQLFPQLSFGSDQPSGICALTRVFIWCQLVTYNDPDTGTSQPILLCLNKNSWFAAYQGPLTWITSLINITSGNPELWGTDGTNIYRCFTGTGNVSWQVKTKFFDLGAFTQLKQFLRMSIQTQNAVGQININAVAINASGVSSTVALSAPSTTFTWLNGSLTFTWTNPNPTIFIWDILPPQIQGPVYMSGDMVGFNLSGICQPFQITGLAFETIPGGEWT